MNTTQKTWISKVTLTWHAGKTERKRRRKKCADWYTHIHIKHLTRPPLKSIKSLWVLLLHTHKQMEHIASTLFSFLVKASSFNYFSFLSKGGCICFVFQQKVVPLASCFNEKWSQMKVIVGVCVCACARVRVCMHACVCGLKWRWSFVCVCARAHACVHACMRVCARACVRACELGKNTELQVLVLTSRHTGWDSWVLTSFHADRDSWLFILLHAGWHSRAFTSHHTETRSNWESSPLHRLHNVEFHWLLHSMLVKTSSLCQSIPIESQLA